jgi:hypothetical protein
MTIGTAVPSTTELTAAPASLSNQNKTIFENYTVGILRKTRLKKIDELF